MRTAGLTLTLATLCLLEASAARAEESPALASVRRAFRELRYEDAKMELALATRRGHYSRNELVALYALRAEVASIVDGPGAGETEFRRLLALAPDYELERNTPVFANPFAHAQRWVERHGHLHVEHKLPEPRRTDEPTPISVSVLADPFAMVAGARLFYRPRADESFVAATGRSLRKTLPPIIAGGSVDYYVEVVDAADNVLLQFGSADEPLRLDGPPAPATLPKPSAIAAVAPAPRPVELVSLRKLHHRHLIAAGVVGGLGLGALAAAIAVDASGQQKYASLASSCAPFCSEAAVQEVRISQNATIGLYTAAGAAFVTSIVLFCVDHFRHAK